MPYSGVWIIPKPSIPIYKNSWWPKNLQILYKDVCGHLWNFFVEYTMHWASRVIKSTDEQCFSWTRYVKYDHLWHKCTNFSLLRMSKYELLTTIQMYPSSSLLLHRKAVLNMIQKIYEEYARMTKTSWSQLSFALEFLDLSLIWNTYFIHILVWFLWNLWLSGNTVTFL